MNLDLNFPPPLPQRLSGRFLLDTAAEAWQWDDAVYRIHGVKPGSVTPTADLVLACKYPRDRERIMALLKRVKKSGEVFSASYRIVGGDGRERRVLLVGGPGMYMDDGSAVIKGFYIDVTDAFEEETVKAVNQAVAASVASQATVEQAKGAVMLAYGLDPEQASAMLRWWSRNNSVTVPELAERLVALAVEGEATDADRRHALDSALHDLTS